VYEKNGEMYFVVDSHVHYWNAAPDNWLQGAEHYAKGWIECLHAYQGLGPPDAHWTIEHFQKYSEDDLMKDIFEAGHVDVAIFQPTYLKEWYKEGFNTTERNAPMGEKHRGKFIYNTRWDPRDGDEGLEHLRRDHKRFGPKGVKLYTTEWNNGSRAGSSPTLERTGTWRRVRISGSRTSTCTRARRRGRWTRIPTSPTSTKRRPTSPN
jgi:hypothetical protein